jgi:hypothetical protein
MEAASTFTFTLNIYQLTRLRFSVKTLWEPQILENILLSGVQRGRGGWGSNAPPRNSEILTKLSQIPISVENTSVTT